MACTDAPAPPRPPPTRRLAVPRDTMKYAPPAPRGCTDGPGRDGRHPAERRGHATLAASARTGTRRRGAVRVALPRRGNRMTWKIAFGDILSKFRRGGDSRAARWEINTAQTPSRRTRHVPAWGAVCTLGTPSNFNPRVFADVPARPRSAAGWPMHCAPRGPAASAPTRGPRGRAASSRITQWHTWPGATRPETPLILMRGKKGGRG